MSDSRSLFVVRFEIEAVVLAESVDGAILVAEANESEITSMGGVWDAVPLRHVPEGWGDPKTLVYHDGEEDIDLFPLLMECPTLSDKAKERLRERAAALEVERAAKQKQREAREALRYQTAGTPEG